MYKTTGITGEIEAFYRRQLDKWPFAKVNYSGLENIRYRHFDIGGFRYMAQYNPSRSVSSGAKVDAVSIAQRPCFLCACNRPEAQEALYLYPDDAGARISRYRYGHSGFYEILINPFPLFHRHLTVVSPVHTPQAIEGRVSHMCAMAAALPGYTVFYNGPRCGASAPDHMHFQAVPSVTLPLWEWCGNGMFRTVSKSAGGCLLQASGLPVPLMLIKASTPRDASFLFRRFIGLYSGKTVDTHGFSEPMMNILARALPQGVEIAVILRSRHRPAGYSSEPGQGFMISPASVDLAGVLVVPRLEDFECLEPSFIGDIIKEVTE